MIKVNPTTVAKLVFETIKIKFGDAREPNAKDFELCDHIIGMNYRKIFFILKRSKNYRYSV
jgi:hypothetical protein